LNEHELAELEDLSVLVMAGNATVEQKVRFGMLVRAAVATIQTVRSASLAPKKGGG
jgi:hypothetical protein